MRDEPNNTINAELAIAIQRVREQNDVKDDLESLGRMFFNYMQSAGQLRIMQAILIYFQELFEEKPESKTEDMQTVVDNISTVFQKLTTESTAFKCVCRNLVFTLPQPIDWERIAFSAIKRNSEVIQKLVSDYTELAPKLGIEKPQVEYADGSDTFAFDELQSTTMH